MANLAKIDPEDLFELQRALEMERCRRSFYYFVKKAWHVLEPARVFIESWHIQVICEHLQAITEGRIKNPRLIVNIPPGCMKSLLIAVFWQAWEWGPAGQPHHQYLSLSYSTRFASRDAMKARDLINSSWYQQYWPIKMKDDQDSKNKYINTDTGLREVLPFDKATGGRGSRLIIDDPVAAAEANSPTIREGVNQTFFESLTNRLNDIENDAIVIIMQRLHQMDLVGAIKDRGLDYNHLVIPMEYQGDKVFDTELQMEDPRTEIGELMFPGKFSRKNVDTLILEQGPYAYSAQYLQNPVPRGDGFFDLTCIDIYDPELREDKEWIKTLHIYMTSDHAPGGKETSDRNVIRVWGVDHRNHKYLLDWFVEQCTMNVAMGIETDTSGKLVLAKNGALPLVAKWKPIYWFPESCNNWKSIAPMVAQVMRAVPGCHTRIRPIPTTGSKEQKATAYDGNIRAGLVHLPRGPETDATLNEYKTFPVGKHDDRVDADAAICRAESAHPGSIRTPPEPPSGPRDYGRGGKRTPSIRASAYG